MLRHSMMLAQWDAGLRFLEVHALIDPVVARVEPSFLHVTATRRQSKFAPLIAPAADDHDEPDATARGIRAAASRAVRLRRRRRTCAEIIGALKTLQAAPTARLERVFAEHVDCVSYRLDAWKTALATDTPRNAATGADQADRDLRSARLAGSRICARRAPSTSVRLEGETAKVFQRANDVPLTHDPANAGYVHAPSLNQAATAAILKNAYRVNASPARPDAMAVNLSSSRVRQALAILEGMRNGQTLGALLGYRFERGLHDEHGLAEVDKFIYPLRQAFPLVANQLQSTKTDSTVDIRLVEARNVVDGSKLADRAKTNPGYPFGLTTLPAATPAERTAIDAEVDRLLDLGDALSDVTLAESVYQVVLGNFDRAAAVTTALQQGAQPPEVQIVQTPRTGFALQHRIALHLDTSIVPTAAMTPRARADAPLASWLARHMPDPADVAVQVSCSSPVLAPQLVSITQAQLGLDPIDLLYLGDLELEQAMAELDDRIVQVVRYGARAHPALAVTIQYTAPTGGVSLFELAAMVRSLRTVVLGSRVLAPTDVALPLEATDDDGAVVDADELAGRVATAVTALQADLAVLAGLQTSVAPLDTYARAVSDALLTIGRYGIPQTGTGQIHDDVRAIYEAMQTKIATIADAWGERSGAYGVAIANYAALGSDPERMALLQQCELLVRASLTVDPPALGAYKVLVDGYRDTLDADLVLLRKLLTWDGTELEAYAAAVAAIVPLVAVHDVIALDISAQQAAIVDLRARVADRVTAVVTDVTQRIAAASAGLTAAATIATPADRIAAVLVEAKRVLGDEIKLVSRFRLSAKRADDVVKCIGGSPALLTDLVAAGRRFPVDEWLYGTARVREKLAAWENATVVGEAFGVEGDAALIPLQFPFVPNDRWTALEFDTANAARNDRLLYTAHFAAPFAPAGWTSGLVLDEWPEVVPTDDVLSGVTFQFDRPSSAPPQSLLLAVPATLTGSWSWDELVATVVETLDAAKSRGVEPAQIDASNYAQVLPSTVMATTLYWITIATNLAMNNRIYDLIGGA